MRRKVLVVDDERFVRELIKIKLERSGLTVVEGTNGLEAVELSRSERPDLILLDVMMPKMNGFEACQRIKDHPDTRLIPILMLTARGEETDRNRGASHGATGYIVKPFSPQDLANQVMEILNKRKGS
jgi:CheY-like chemotaxis protein